VIRAFVSGMRIHLIQFVRNPFDIAGVVLWPIVYASIAYYLLDAKNDPSLLLSASLGAAVMLMWSLVVIGSAGALEQQRWLGTLELLVASPTRFALILVPVTTAMASLGLFSLGCTLLWGWLLFGITVPIESPLAFALSVMVSIFSVALLGFLLSVAVVRYRTAWAMGNLLEYPGWLLCGFLVPLALFPGWVTWIAYALPPTWGMAPIRASASGVSPWRDILVCLGLGLAYGLVGALVSEGVLRSARRHATLSLT
jgi:ABC-2 type transport system permease protein